MKKNHTADIIYDQVMFRTFHYKTLPSTHKWALEHLSSFIEEHVLITVDCQTDGIGRKNTPWVAHPLENITLTYIFPTPKKDTACLAHLLSFSALQTLQSLDFEPLFKWPNDLLLSGKKVAGVMVDIRGEKVCASIGMNINMSKESALQLGFSATSLLIEHNHPFDLLSVQSLLTEQFAKNLTQFVREGFAPFLTAFSEKLAYKGRLVQIESLIGTLIDISPDGRLIIESEGKTILIPSGSLSLLS